MKLHGRVLDLFAWPFPGLTAWHGWGRIGEESRIPGGIHTTGMVMHGLRGVHALT